MSKRAFGSQLAVTATALGAFVLAEGVLCALRDVWGVTAWCLGLWAAPAAIAAVSSAWLLAALCDDGALVHALADLWRRPPARHASLVAAAVLSLVAGWVFWGTQAFARYHNRELSAALLAGSTAALAVVLGLVAFVIGREPRRGRAAAALLASAAVWSWILWA